MQQMETHNYLSGINFHLLFHQLPNLKDNKCILFEWKSMIHKTRERYTFSPETVEITLPRVA